MHTSPDGHNDAEVRSCEHEGIDRPSEQDSTIDDLFGHGMNGGNALPTQADAQHDSREALCGSLCAVFCPN